MKTKNRWTAAPFFSAGSFWRLFPGSPTDRFPATPTALRCFRSLLISLGPCSSGRKNWSSLQLGRSTGDLKNCHPWVPEASWHMFTKYQSVSILRAFAQQDIETNELLDTFENSWRRVFWAKLTSSCALRWAPRGPWAPKKSQRGCNYPRGRQFTGVFFTSTMKVSVLWSQVLDLGPLEVMIPTRWPNRGLHSELSWFISRFTDD